MRSERYGLALGALMAAMAGASEARAQRRPADDLHFDDPPTIAMRFGGDAGTTRPAQFTPAQVDALRLAMGECVTKFESEFHLASDSSAWWYGYRTPQREMPVLLVPDSVLSGDADSNLDLFASYRPHPIAHPTTRDWRGNPTFARVPVILIPHSIFDRPIELQLGSVCHELMHSVLVGTMIGQAGNRSSDLFIDADSTGLPWWIGEGAPDSVLWLFNGGRMAGRHIDLYAAASRIPQVNPTGTQIYKLLGLRPYSDSIFVDHWLPRTGRNGARAASIDDAQDHAYRTSSFHRWLRAETTTDRWFRVIATVGSVRRSSSDRAWLQEFIDRWDNNVGTKLRELVPRFFASFAYEHEKFVGAQRTGVFTQAGWLRRMYPTPEHCERFVFRQTGLGRFSLTIHRRIAFNEDQEQPRAASAAGHFTEFNDIDPYASRCVQLEAMDSLGHPMALSLTAQLTRPASARNEQDPECNELTLATTSVLGSVHLPSAPERGLNQEARATAQCHVSTTIQLPAAPTALSPRTVLTMAYIPRSPAGARPTAVQLRVIPDGGGQSVSPPSVPGATRKSSAPKNITPASAPFVNLGAVVLHDDGPTSCDPAWSNFCGPATAIAVARTREQATLLEGMWAVPPSMVRPIPDSLAPEDIAELPVPTLTVPSPRAPGPQVTGIRMPRLAPGQLGLINNAVLSAQEGDSLGPVAQRVDERCARRRFPTTARVNITVNDGFVLAGTFEAELYTDQGATPDREGCVRVRRSAGTIRGSFSTGLLSSGWYFQDTHEDFARIMGNSASSGFDRPNTWMYRFLAQRSANSANSANAQGSGTGGMTDANGAQIITRALAAGAQVSLPAQCACSCGEFLSPLLRSSCGGSCASAFAEFEREPQRCAGQQASPANSAGARAPTDAETEAQWAAFLQRLPESSRERLRRQVESNPDARMMMIRMVLSMQQSITPMRDATDAGVTR